jgi:hypothetical protein
MSHNYDRDLHRARLNHILFEHVVEQTPETCLEHIQRNPDFLQYVRAQTEELCLEAVKRDGFALQHVKEQTPEICRVAIEQVANRVEERHGWGGMYKYPNVGSLLQIAKYQPEEACLIAVTVDSSAIREIKEQTPALVALVVKEDHNLFVHINQQTKENCLAAVNSNYNTLMYVDDQTLDICVAAMKQNIQAFEHIKLPTVEICLAALQIDKSVYRNIDESMLNHIATLTITDVCLAMYSFRLPSYVLLEIIDWLLDPNTLTHGNKIKQVIAINERKIEQKL